MHVSVKDDGVSAVIQGWVEVGPPAMLRQRTLSEDHAVVLLNDCVVGEITLENSTWQCREHIGVAGAHTYRDHGEIREVLDRLSIRLGQAVGLPTDAGAGNMSGLEMEHAENDADIRHDTPT